jgi:hypothetical protein
MNPESTPAYVSEDHIVETEDIITLAAIIREVNGGNRLGASALAEAILSHPNAPAIFQNLNN